MNKKAIKIILPVIIVILVMGIWLYKNSNTVSTADTLEIQGKAIIRFVDVWKYPEAADGLHGSADMGCL